MMTTTHPQSQSQSQSLDDLVAAQARRSSIARMGAYAMYANNDAREIAAKRMATRMRRYRERVDPTGDLARRDPQELQRRVEAALKLDMEKVRYAKSQRASDRKALQEMLLRTPSDDVRQVAAITAALALNEKGEDHPQPRTQPHTQPRTHKRGAASVSAEAAPKPLSTRKQANRSSSSDGGALTISPSTRRRQTSTPTSSTRTSQKKAETSRDNNTPASRD